MNNATYLLFIYTELASRQQLEAEAEIQRHKAEMREFESTYDSCTKDWETRCQLSETRLSALTLELAGAKAEYQRASDESAQLREAATVLTEQVISSTLTELTTENESLRASLCAKDEAIAQLEASVVNLTEEKSALLTQLEAATTNINTATKVEVPSEITTDAHSTAQAESTSPSTTPTPTPEASSELPSLKTATSQQPSINSNNGCPTHIFHYVPAEYSDQSWSECIPPSTVSGVGGAGYSHSETYHHVYHAPPPRYSSPGPGRFQTSSDMPIGVSSSMTARELATLMARSSTHTPHVRASNNSRYASPVRRSYANPPADFGELTHLEEIRMKLDILKSLTDPTRIATQRVVRAVGPFSSNYDTGNGMMSYYDNLRASLHK